MADQGDHVSGVISLMPRTAPAANNVYSHHHTETQRDNTDLPTTSVRAENSGGMSPHSLINGDTGNELAEQDCNQADERESRGCHGSHWQRS